jgi:Family of unknown function (DUF6220)
MSENQAVAAGTGTPAGQSGTGLASRTGRRRAMLVFHWALAAFLLLLAAQIFLAGLGAFRTEAVGADSAFSPHRTFGFALGAVALVILVLALVARAGRAAITGAAAIVVLVNVAQSVLATLADDHALYGGLHAFDGLAIIGIAAWLWARTRPGGRQAGQQAPS